MDFVRLLLVTAYCKIYAEKAWRKHAGKVFIICVSAMMLHNILLNVLYTVFENEVFVKAMPRIFVSWNPLIIACGMSLFWLFKDKKWESKTIGSLGKHLWECTFYRKSCYWRRWCRVWCKWFDLLGIFNCSGSIYLDYLCIIVYAWSRIEQLLFTKLDSKLTGYL